MTKDLSPLPADDLDRQLVIATPDAADVRHLSLAGGTYSILVSGAQTDGCYTLIDMLIPPGGGPPLHRHDFEEAFILLDGELSFTFRGESQQVAAPATVAIPANAPHAFRNTSDRVVHVLCLCTPAGQDDFFERVGDILPSRNSPTPVLSDAEQAQKRALAQSLALSFRTEFVRMTS